MYSTTDASEKFNILLFTKFLRYTDSPDIFDQVSIVVIVDENIPCNWLQTRIGTRIFLTLLRETLVTWVTERNW